MPIDLSVAPTPNMILVASLVLVVLLLIVFFRKSVAADRLAAAAEHRADAEAKRAEALEAEVRRPAPEADRDDVGQLLDDLPAALRVPDDANTFRLVAAALGEGIARLLGPEQWMVFLDIEGDGKQFQLMATAARSGSTWPVGACLTPQMGRVGLVIRRKRTMEPTDFLAEPPLVRDQVRESEPGVFRVDVATPIFLRDRVVGAIAIGGSRKPDDVTRSVLRLMAGQASLLRRLAMATERATELENRDGVTGLHNRNAFLARGGEMLFQNRDRIGAVSCAVFGIDDFGLFAAREGPGRTQRLLSEVARIIRPIFRSGDLLCRWGEREFAVLLPGAARPTACELLDRARHAVSSTEFEGATMQPEGVVTISVGMASAPEDGSSLDALVDHAQRAYLTSQKRGGDRTSEDVELDEDFLDAVSGLAEKTQLRSPGDPS